MTRSILALGMIGLMLSASLSLALSQQPARDPRYPAHWWTPVIDPKKP